MSLADALEDALNATKPGDLAGSSGKKLQAAVNGHKAEVHVMDVDRIGVRVRRVRVSRPTEIDVVEAATVLPGRVRALPETLVPIEVDRALGQAILRTSPEELSRREFFELDVRQTGDVDVRRFKIADEGDRSRTDWTMTRDQLGRLLDELGGE